MKTCVRWIIAVAAVAAGTALSAHTFMKKEKDSKPDSEGHQLAALWKSYDGARRADRPKKMVEVLGQIKQEARAKRLHWDFYDAATRYVEDAAARNWKLRDSLEAKCSQEIADYAEPLVSYYYGRSRGQNAWRDFVLSSRRRLEAGRNAAFYRNSGVGSQLSGLLPDFIRDDFEFVLWKESADDPSGKEWAVPVLAEHLGTTYPNAPFLEYSLLMDRFHWRYVMETRDAKRNAEKEKALRAYAEKYAGKAVSLLAKEVLLMDRMRALNDQGSSSDYRDLFAACRQVEQERSRYAGEPEGKIAKRCTDAANLMATLQRKDIQVSCSEDTALVLLRNLDRADFVMKRVRDDKVLLRQTLDNPVRSFYAWDTVKVALPEVDDGDYRLTVTNGKLKDECRYEPHTLSIAVQTDREGHKFYVADFRTGEPVKKVDLELLRSGKQIAQVRDVPMDGFTRLPEAIETLLRKDAQAQLAAILHADDGLLRRTHEQSVRDRGIVPGDPEEPQVYCETFTDRTAYNPGETAQFKAVLFRGDMRHALHTLGAGEKVVVELYNAESKRIDVRELTTNEYGSVAGEFPLPAQERNGRFHLSVLYGDKNVSSLSLTVDAFILPTYDLQFGDLDSLYFKGDTVEVRGRVSSYSGHPLSAARFSYTVDAWGDRIGEGTLALEEDGSFVLRFASQEDRYLYDVKVKVVDRTGETKEFSRRVFILDRVNLSVRLVNAQEGSVQLAEKSGGRPRPGYLLPEEIRKTPYGPPVSILSGESATLRFEARNGEGKVIPAEIGYRILDASGAEVYKGTAASGTERRFRLEASGLYTVKSKVQLVSARGDMIENENSAVFLRVLDDDPVLAAPIEHVFKVLGNAGPVRSGETFGLQFGAGRGDVWALVQLFDDRQGLLDRQQIHLSGQAGTEGSLTRIAYAYKAEWPDAVLLKVFYFKDEARYEYSREFRRERPSLELPLAFETFEDRTLPATEYSFTLKTRPGVEAVAAVFDKSTETLSPNRWSGVSLAGVRCDAVSIAATPGNVGGDTWDTWGSALQLQEVVVMGFGSGRKKMATRAMPEVAELQEATVMAADMAVPAPAEAEALADVAVRSDFSASLAFEPFLRSDADGRMKLTFKTSDKLSTYYVQIFAHDPAMRNATLRQEMVVTIPVKVAVAEPKYLYAGDEYSLQATVSNNSDWPVSGTLGLLVSGEGDAVVQSLAKPVTVPAGGVASATFPVPVGKDSLRLKVVFADAAKTFSDGVLVALPVYEARQTLTEAHSAVLRAGMDKEALLREIAARFTGTTAHGATTDEVDIRRMLRDAIPSRIEPDGKDVLSLSEALYARHLAALLQPGFADSLSAGKMPDTELRARILACQNADGGFGWFEGMKSSPVITATLLERFSKMRESAALPLSDAQLTAAVRYLDRQQFLYDRERPFWFGGLSMAQYAYVRSTYASVPFEVDRTNRTEKSAYAEHIKDFKEALGGYLLPKARDGRGLNGRILDKSRRIKTLLQLQHNPGGLQLAAAWGIRFGAASRLNRSTKADLQSLLEYAVAHRDGGWYYPDAVLPWRGLLESELYAHSLLCDLLSAPQTRAVLADAGARQEALKVADGIRLWIMLQKETQQWDTDPAYLEAIRSVMKGSEDVLSTTVVFMRKTYGKPFEDIVAAGNGFTIERRFFKEVKGAPAQGTSLRDDRPNRSGAHEINRLEVRPGDLLHVGDKLIAEYRIWNQENRSFVKLTAPREAGFRPADQLSGHYGWWLRPLSVRGFWSVTPQGYRNVKTDRTEYYFDVYPEEKTTVTETFFVTQEGSFRAPVVTIESRYAPHYRANDGFRGTFQSR